MNMEIRPEKQVTVEQATIPIGGNGTDDSNFIVEGTAKLDVCSPAVAFYNPAQQFNRDLT